MIEIDKAKQDRGHSGKGIQQAIFKFCVFIFPLILVLVDIFNPVAFFLAFGCTAVLSRLKDRILFSAK